MAEVPGITPKVAAFARRVAAIGCTAVMPHLFGTPGQGSRRRRPRSARRPTALSTLVPLCVSREFTTWATNRTSPVIDWLRALAAHEHERCGGPGVGAVGMCFTGGFALAMATHPSILAPVLSQPSMPMAVTKRQRASIDCSPADLDAVRGPVCRRGAHRPRPALPRRLVRARRSASRSSASSSATAFVAVELDDAAANPAAAMKPHSVLTEHLIDEPGQPTRAALDQVLDLFRTRLLA